MSGDKLAHLQEHFVIAYTALVQCTDIAADLWQGWDGNPWSSTSTLSPVGSNIGLLYQSCIYNHKSAPEDGRVCRPKHVEQIQIDQ